MSDVELPTRKGCHVFRASNKMEAAAAVVTEATEHSRRPLEGQTNHGGLPKVRELTLKLHISRGMFFGLIYFRILLLVF